MKVPYGEGVASHTGPESCVLAREGGIEALTGVRAGWAIEPRKAHIREAEAVLISRRQHPAARKREGGTGSRGVEDPMHARKHLTRRDNPSVRKPGDPRLGPCCVAQVRVMNPQGER
jgi:hypothetical protein